MSADKRPFPEGEKWAQMIAELATDGLLSAGLIANDQFERAAEIISEEIFVRLCLHDYPPKFDHVDD